MIKKSRIGIGAGILFGKAYHNLWASHLHEQAKRLIEIFYEQIAVQEDKTTVKYWGEKHPHLSVCLPFVSELYPDATYVYAVRDPMDVACSIAQMNGVVIRKAIDSWKRFADTYEIFIESLPPERLKVIKYEDLVLDYESVLSELLNELGLDLDNASRQYLAKHKNKDSHNPGTKQTFDFYTKSVGRWTRDMTNEEQTYGRLKCSDFVTKYGYIQEPEKHHRTPILSTSNAISVDSRTNSIDQTSTGNAAAANDVIPPFEHDLSYICSQWNFSVKV